MYCPKCGAEYPAGNRFCPKCGAELNPSVGVSTQESQSAQIERETRPNNYLILAIIVTILGCMPAGIVSIVYASRVDRLYNDGRHKEAVKASKKAFKWVVISTILQVVAAIIYLLYIKATGICYLDLYRTAANELMNNM